jgi:hypothetical protein
MAVLARRTCLSRRQSELQFLDRILHRVRLRLGARSLSQARPAYRSRLRWNLHCCFGGRCSSGTMGSRQFVLLIGAFRRCYWSLGPSRSRACAYSKIRSSFSEEVVSPDRNRRRAAPRCRATTDVPQDRFRAAASSRRIARSCCNRWPTQACQGQRLARQRRLLMSGSSIVRSTKCQFLVS